MTAVAWSKLRSHRCTQVTEAELAAFFMDCGRVLDCRICGDPNSATRFAFIEFIEADGAEKVRCSSEGPLLPLHALCLGSLSGCCPGRLQSPWMGTFSGRATGKLPGMIHAGT